jgi:hypothetical protein
MGGFKSCLGITCTDTPDVTLVQEIAVELVNLVVSTDGGRSLFGSLVRLMSIYCVLHVGTHTISSVT